MLMTENHLDCDQAQVAISALLDDEDPAVDQEQLANHLDQCEHCAAWRRQAERVRRSLRLQRVQVPDLTESVLAAVAADPRIGQAAAIVRGRRTVLRVGLAIAALAQLLMALPLLAAGPQTPRAEASWEMAAFEIALAVGLVFVAWRPTYARAFVPVSVVLSLGLILGGVRNVSTDPAVLARNLSYLLAIVQAGLVWGVARGEPSTPDRDRSQNPPAWWRRIHTMATRALTPIAQHKSDWVARCRRLLVRLLFGAGIAIGVMAATPSPALAHAVLVRTDPAENALLGKAPAAVTLTFDERVEPVKKAFSVVGPNGKSANTGSPASTGSGKQISMRLASHLPQGTYLVSYRVISADGHPVGGGFDFSVGKRSTPPHAVSAAGEGGTDPGVRAALSVSKYAGYAGAALVAGSALMLLALWPHRLNRRPITRMVWTGWALLLIGAAGQFVVQIPYTTGGGLADFDASGGLRSVATSTVGVALLVRLALVLAAAPFLRLLTRDGVVSALWRWCLLSLGVLAAFTWPIAGHPGAARGRLIAIASDALHVTAMSLWLGGLVVLVAALLRRARVRELALILPVWSRWALAAVAMLGVTGVISALLTMDGVGPLFRSAYGWLVIAKVAGLCLIITIASISRRWVRQRLPLLSSAPEEGESPEQTSKGEGDREEEPAVATSRIRRLVGLEIVLAVVVLGLATALTQTSPRVAASDVPSNAHAGSYTATLRSGDTTLMFELDPGQRGNNSLHLTAINAQRNPVPVLEWRASAALPAKHIAPIDISLLSLAENHVTGEVSLPSAGQWLFHITARTSDVDEISVDRKVPIS